MTRVRISVDGASLEYYGIPNLTSPRVFYCAILILHVPFSDRSIVPCV